MKTSNYIFLIALLIVITIPRFNWGELGFLNFLVGGKPFDVEQYETYVSYFRGEIEGKANLEGPFAYRPLVPLFASILPFKPLTAINLINVLSLILSLLVLQKLLAAFNYQKKLVFVGEILFVVSFPVFYYATSGYIDAVLIFFILLSFYLLLKKKTVHFILIFILGVAVKETMAIMIPVLVAVLFIRKDIRLGRKVFFLLFILAILFIETFLLRYYTPGKDVYVWTPRIEVLINNLTRFKTYVSILFTFGLPGLGALLFLRCSECKEQLGRFKNVLYTGLVCSMLITLFSIISAYSDGRHIWTSYPFTIPLAIAYLSKRYQNKKSLGGNIKS